MRVERAWEVELRSRVRELDCRYGTDLGLE